MKYPHNVRVIKLPCTGRVSAIQILTAIEDGADGVCVVGCREGDCHFISGNIKARRQVEYVKSILESLGIEPERVEMYNLSASDGPLFAKYATEHTEKVLRLGPVFKGKMIQAN